MAYLSTCGSGASAQRQIFLFTPKTAQTRQLTHVSGNFEELSWAPDGSRIGFLFVENATRSAGALDAMKPWSGVIGEDGVETQRVAVASVATGAVTSVTPLSLHAFEFDWAPDSRSVAYIAAATPGENNWWVANLYTQPISGDPSAAPRLFSTPAKLPVRSTPFRSPFPASLQTAHRSPSSAVS